MMTEVPNTDRPQRILIQTCGSRGDMQPFFAIGSALQDAGYNITIATNDNHVPKLVQNGMKAVGVYPDAEYEMKNSPGLVASMAEGDFANFLKGLNEVWKKTGESIVVKWVTLVEDLKPDLIISGTLCEALALIGERRYGIPVINALAFFFPGDPIRVAMGLPNLPCCCKRLIHRYIAKSMVGDMVAVFGPHTKKHYGFHPDDFWTTQDTYDMKFNPPFGQICGMNARLAKIMNGETPGVKFVGHFAVDTASQVGEQKKEIEKQVSQIFGDTDVLTTITEFIEAGSKPVYMGFGSMTAKSPEHMITLLMKGLKHAGVRAIVYEGWAHLGVDLLKKASKDTGLIEYTKENVLFVGSTPHAWLFPRCAAIIHHGGAGTVSTALRSGTPQIIIPCFLDQWDFAWAVNQSGFGIGFDRTNLPKVQPEPIGDAIKKILSTPSYQKTAAEWAEDANAEPGAQGIITFVQDFWTKHVVTGAYKRHVDQRLKAFK